MGMREETGRVEYHYGFYGAVHAQYEPSGVKMEYLQEHELGNEPVRMDMLILKRDTTPLKDPIGSFFRTHNVLEYKSPGNATRDDLIKLLTMTENNSDPNMLDHIRAILNVSIVLNEALFKEIKEAGIMTEALDRVFRNEFARERQEGRQEGFLEALAELVKDGVLSITEAAGRAGMTPSDFQSKTAGLSIKR